MKYELRERYWNIPEEDLINDVIAVAKKLGKDTLTAREYKQGGKYSPEALMYRFKSWKAVMKRAGLKPSRVFVGMVADEILFENLAEVWTKLGRQPTCKEMKQPLSMYDGRSYSYRYGTWMNALRKFVEYINSKSPGSANIKGKITVPEEIKEKKDKANEIRSRSIPHKLKFSIFLRDGFRCVACGRGPLTHPGVELHCDHIKAWSDGGQTVMDNLQTLCSDCNFGKGNMPVIMEVVNRKSCNDEQNIPAKANKRSWWQMPGIIKDVELFEEVKNMTPLTPLKGISPAQPDSRDLSL